ncbi:MAG: hypothetical protein HYR56_15885 [Acidobacteria bacterium]|nr:hypothetical protein [Acidobacteriota bacterium]
MDIFNSVFGDSYTRQMLAAIALLIVAAILWLVWKFFFSLFKHVLMALFIAAIASTVYYYVMNQPPPRDTSVGKHAYGVSSGRYLGVVEGAQNDPQSGPVWIIRQPGGQPTKLAKARVIVKDKMEPLAAESPAATATPAQNPKPRPSKK